MLALVDRLQSYPNFSIHPSLFISEAPLLGKISRTRRAKSANTRSRSSRSKKRFFNESESSSSDNTVTVPSKKSTSNQLDYASERMKQIKESLQKTCTSADIERMRPINIDVALANENL